MKVTAEIYYGVTQMQGAISSLIMLGQGEKPFLLVGIIFPRACQRDPGRYTASAFNPAWQRQ
jgi:hypothetical protein